MNFLFVDRILELEPEKRVVGLKHVTASDTYITRSNYDQRPRLFSSIIGEALGQLGAWAAMVATDFKLRPVAGILGEAKLIKDVFVGDTMLLETIIDGLTEKGMQYHSTAYVNNEPVFTLKDMLGPMLPMTDFIDEATVRQQYEMINRPGPVPEFPVSQRSLPDPTQMHYFSGVDFDHVLQWEKGEEIVVQKNISFNAPYFVDHFPRKPVLPLTLFLEAKLRLAQLFLTDMLGEERFKKFRPNAFTRVKMTRFVQPGAIVIMTMSFVSQDDERIVLKCNSRMDGKTICVARLDFVRA